MDNSPNSLYLLYDPQIGNYSSAHGSKWHDLETHIDIDTCEVVVKMWVLKY